MIEQLYTTQNLPSGSILMKSADGGRTGTKYRIAFIDRNVSFTPVASAYLGTDNTIIEIPIIGMPAITSKASRLENYLRYQNRTFPLYQVIPQ